MYIEYFKIKNIWIKENFDVSDVNNIYKKFQASNLIKYLFNFDKKIF